VARQVVAGFAGALVKGAYEELAAELLVLERVQIDVQFVFNVRERLRYELIVVCAFAHVYYTSNFFVIFININLRIMTMETLC